MKCNVGKTERIIRIVTSLALMALGAVWWKGFYLASAFVFLTAVIAWCPITTALGISTCKETDQEDIPADTVSTDKNKHRDRRFK
jgi:hypothetical protein